MVKSACLVFQNGGWYSIFKCDQNVENVAKAIHEQWKCGNIPYVKFNFENECVFVPQIGNIVKVQKREE